MLGKKAALIWGSGLPSEFSVLERPWTLPSASEDELMVGRVEQSLGNGPLVCVQSSLLCCLRLGLALLVPSSLIPVTGISEILDGLWQPQ